LLQALGRQLCVLGYRVRYTTGADFLRDLSAALADQTLPKRTRYWSSFDLLILNEFGCDKIERNEFAQVVNLLCKVIDAWDGHVSTALDTNIDFEHWGDYLGDPPLAIAFRDRILDGAAHDDQSSLLSCPPGQAHRPECGAFPGKKCLAALLRSCALLSRRLKPGIDHHELRARLDARGACPFGLPAHANPRRTTPRSLPMNGSSPTDGVRRQTEVNWLQRFVV